MNIIYEASILLLTIPGEMLSMQKCCCYDTKYKNTCIVCILRDFKNAYKKIMGLKKLLDFQ